MPALALLNLTLLRTLHGVRQGRSGGAAEANDVALSVSILPSTLLYNIGN